MTAVMRPSTECSLLERVVSCGCRAGSRRCRRREVRFRANLSHDLFAVLMINASVRSGGSYTLGLSPAREV